MPKKKVKKVIYNEKEKHIEKVIFTGNKTPTDVKTANKMAKKGQIEGVLPYGDNFITGEKNGIKEDNLLNKINNLK